MQHRRGGQVQVLGQPAPQARLGVDAGHPVAVPPVAAELVPAGQAVLAGPARHDHFQRHPVAGLDAPALRGALADLLDDPERLVAGDESRPGPAEMAPEGLDVAAADAVGLHPQQPVVRADPRARELAELDLARADLHGRAHHVSHQLSCSFRCPAGRAGPGTGTAAPDQPANSRTTIEIPALRAPATAMSRFSRHRSPACARTPRGVRHRRAPHAAAEAVLADAGEVCGTAAAAFRQPCPHLRAVEACAGEQLGMFRAEHDSGRRVLEDPRAGAADRVGEVAEQLLRAARVPVVDELAGAQQCCRRGRGAVGNPALADERRPGTLLLVLRHADRPPAGQPLGGLLQLVRMDPVDVAHDQPDRPGHCRVRPEPRPEGPASGVKAQLGADRAVHHDQWSWPARRLPAAAAGRPLPHQRFPRGQDHREVLRPQPASTALMAASPTVTTRSSWGSARPSSGLRPAAARTCPPAAGWPGPAAARRTSPARSNARWPPGRRPGRARPAAPRVPSGRRLSLAARPSAVRRPPATCLARSRTCSASSTRPGAR